MHAAAFYFGGGVIWRFAKEWRLSRTFPAPYRERATRSMLLRGGKNDVGGDRNPKGVVADERDLDEHPDN
jgi:hypothetical protein